MPEFLTLFTTWLLKPENYAKAVFALQFILVLCFAADLTSVFNHIAPALQSGGCEGDMGRIIN